MEKNDVLSGFDAIAGALSPINGFSPDDDFENISDEDLENLKKNSIKTPSVTEVFGKDSTKSNEIEDEEEIDDGIDLDEEDEEEEIPELKKPRGRPRKQVEEEIDEDESESQEEQSTEGIQVSMFFDAVAEELGLDTDEEEDKPKTVEDLVTYFRDLIKEESVPTYASEEVAELDEFVRNGGRIEDYIQVFSDLDIEDIDISEETNQKRVIREFLAEKGFSAKQISKKIDKYESAGLLEDEAEDALEALKDIREEKREKLLEEQEIAYRTKMQAQQEYATSVVDCIKSLDDIRGIKIPEKDKRSLLNYIFKPDASGKTQYQKDYAKNVKNLVESAYFTMKGDTLLDTAKKTGSNSAIKNLKQSLNSSSATKGTKRIKTDSKSTAFSSAIKQLINF